VVLRDPAHRVSPRTPLVWAAGALVPVLFVAAVLVVGTAVWHWWEMPVAGWVGYAVVGLGYLTVMPAVRYRIHRWETTDVAVYTQSGWLSRERRIAPMSRVQTVDVEQGPVARLLGLASVTVTTASAAGPLRIDGLDRATADRLVADLTRQTQAQPGDAT
jgi:membrane protein YdbS with pleckstrin-like domain